MSNWYGIAKVAAGIQKGWTDQFGEVQRYALDSYRCDVFLTQTNQKYAVSVAVNHDMFGLTVFQEFWKYGLDERQKAEATFSEAKKIVSGIFADFRSSEEPNALLHTYIREAVRHLDADHKPSTRIPWVNNARHVDGEHDWRSSIYGTRYPQPTGY
jgi:hypothetical protein